MDIERDQGYDETPICNIGFNDRVRMRKGYTFYELPIESRLSALELYERDSLHEMIDEIHAMLYKMVMKNNE